MKVSQELSISFWLRKSKSETNGKRTIMLRLVIRGERDDVSLGYQVNPAKFCKKSGIINGSSAEVIEINKAIAKTRTDILYHYNRLKDEGDDVTPAMIMLAYQGVGRECRKLLEAADFHIKKFEEKVTAGKRSPETLKKWHATREKLNTFVESEYKLPDLPLSRINHTFAEDFFDYLTLKDGLSDNTAMKHIKCTKQILTLAVRRKWMYSNPLTGFRCTYVDPERDILNESELAVLYHKKFDVPRLQEAKDIYLFMALTGFAYKDTLLLTPDHVTKFFDGEDWIVKNREKTWCRENVPLLPQAKELLKRYSQHPECIANGRLFPVRSNQRFNGYLKEIADLAGIRKNLTTHTARHTFATTVTLANGVPLETVSSMLGHKSIRTTQIYAKIVAGKVSKDMLQLKTKFVIGLPQSLFDIAAA